MSEKRKKPTERQKNCSFSFPYMGENFDEVYCSKKVEDDLVTVSAEECESCIQFKNKHIQYPIEVNKIKYEPFESWNRYEPGTPVRIMPCAKEYKEKTYFGMYLGNLPTQNYVSYERKNKQLDICIMNNTAIYVFELKKIIYGCESYWSVIDDPNDFEDITKEMIDNVWYVQLLKGFYKNKEDKKEGEKECNPKEKI